MSAGDLIRRALRPLLAPLVRAEIAALEAERRAGAFEWRPGEQKALLHDIAERRLRLHGQAEAENIETVIDRETAAFIGQDRRGPRA